MDKKKQGKPVESPQECSTFTWVVWVLRASRYTGQRSCSAARSSFLAPGRQPWPSRPSRCRPSPSRAKCWKANKLFAINLIYKLRHFTNQLFSLDVFLCFTTPSATNGIIGEDDVHRFSSLVGSRVKTLAPLLSLTRTSNKMLSLRSVPFCASTPPKDKWAVQLILRVCVCYHRFVPFRADLVMGIRWKVCLHLFTWSRMHGMTEANADVFHRSGHKRKANSTDSVVVLPVQ